jgi:hypothetical protein
MGHLRTKNARAGSRRAQFELWIFSYTIRRALSKKRLSRLLSSGPVMPAQIYCAR